jgi:hypothetical protein
MDGEILAGLERHDPEAVVAASSRSWDLLERAVAARGRVPGEADDPEADEASA